MTKTGFCQHLYNIKQTSNEKEEKYQLEDYEWIQNQILQTNITSAVWQTVRSCSRLRLEQLLRIFRALQTSRVLHISMNARMNHESR